jgi:hypothetical protein
MTTTIISKSCDSTPKPPKGGFEKFRLNKSPLGDLGVKTWKEDYQFIRKKSNSRLITNQYEKHSHYTYPSHDIRKLQ